MGQIGFVYWA